jgi:hypothetical protein
MRGRWLAAIAVFALAAGLVLWREWSRPQRPSIAPAHPRIVLFADLSEVDEAEGCGAIIRGVRGAASIMTEEIDARTASNRPAHYRLLVPPTVLFLDVVGNELTRYEGESAATVGQIQAEIDRLVGAR